MARRCNYAECTPCFREWVAFLKQRQGQASRVPGTDIVVRISEQTSIKPETPAEGYRLVFSRKPECQAVIEERDRLAAECTPKPRHESLVESMTWTANEQLNLGQCEAAGRTVKAMQRYMRCTSVPKKRKRKP